MDGWPYTCDIFNKIMRSIQQGDDQIIQLEDADDVKDADDAEKAAPTLLWAPEKTTPALGGKSLELKCLFAGNPTPKVTWKVKGEVVAVEESASSFSSSSGASVVDYGRGLRIRKVRPDDAGSYECVGSNGVGVDISASTVVEVESEPFFVAPKPADREEVIDDVM